MLRKQPIAAIARLARQQVNDFARLDVPFVAQQVGDLAFEQKAVGEQLVARRLSQANVFDRVAKRPMPQVVQQGRNGKPLCGLRRDCGRKPLVVRESVEVQQRHAIHAERVLEPRVIGRRIDEPHQPQLADARQPAELGRIDKLPHARRERHVQLGRNPHHVSAGAKGDKLGNVAERVHEPDSPQRAQRTRGNELAGFLQLRRGSTHSTPPKVRRVFGRADWINMKGLRTIVLGAGSGACAAERDLALGALFRLRRFLEAR